MQCSNCGKVKSKRLYSQNQKLKGEGSARCKECIELAVLDDQNCGKILGVFLLNRYPQGCWCDNCSRGIGGKPIVERCDYCDHDLCRKCVNDGVTHDCDEGEEEEDDVEEDDSDDGEILGEFLLNRYPQGYSCDNCSRGIGGKPIVERCDYCDHDLCRKCVNDGVTHDCEEDEEEEDDDEEEDDEELEKRVDLWIRTRRNFNPTNPCSYKCGMSSVVDEFGPDIEAFVEDCASLLVTYSNTGSSMVQVKYLTPFQGEASHRVFGYFKCICGGRWNSAGSWINTWQKCKTCESCIYPYNQHPLEIKEEREGEEEKRPHHTDKCQKCILLGRLCMPSIYYEAD